ncbi:MAG: hypothetical protein HY315_03455 [Acidobacteria bacterium]|nr:hypothetical protein [Acidobacteriota bacterium]
MNIRLEPQRAKNSGVRLILGVALGAAALIGAALWIWMRTSTPVQEGGIEGLLRPGDAEFENYQGRVTLEVQKSTLARNFAGNRVVMVAGVIHNRSDRWLEAVRVQVTLRSGRQPVLQQTRFPVAPGSRVKPIGPREDLPFTVWVEQIPADWSGGGVDVEITGLKPSGLSR